MASLCSRQVNVFNSWPHVGTSSCQKCTNFYIKWLFLFTQCWLVVKNLHTWNAGSLFFTLKYSWVWSRSQAKALGEVFGKTSQHFQNGSTFAGLFLFFLSSFTEGEKCVQRDPFVAQCCHLSAPECNFLQSMNDPQPHRYYCSRKVPFYWQSRSIFIAHINSAAIPRRPAFR